MPIIASQAINNIKSELEKKGFDLKNAPQTEIFIESLVKNILDEVKQGTVTTTVTGVAAMGVVTGKGIGNIK